ncbi:metallothiol transferase [Tumebacillus sp. BK434]|uniref:VOC family protein n=1 Tax=Tumebacillus sp. BK434 TaxID=2512169 RepID=UPI0010517610|nr:VOC family protein [Tumebacillus sp. BK434]TCP58170.1 metallothiol transferase [Tumebacillus sp. BK434]
MFETKGLNHITIFVENFDRTLYFYKEILRMRVVHQGGHYAYLESGATWICLSGEEIGQARPSRLEQLHLALTVDDADFEQAVQHLRDHNVPIVRGPVARGVGKTVNFLDPDGVEWEFHTSNLAERMRVIAEMERSKA